MAEQETASLVNHMMGHSPPVVPAVGDGATELCWTDRHAFTVIAVSKSGKRVTVQRDIATRSDKNGMSDCQSYIFSRDPNGETRELKLSKRKGWTDGSARFSIGTRSEHYDYSF